MPRIRTLKTKPPPDGWDEIEPVLEEMNQRMQDAESESHEGKRVAESLWPLYRLHHERTRYIYEMYRDDKISKQLYDYCTKEKHADANLIAKWKKHGYEKLCCLRCIQVKDSNFSTTCICRVPKEELGSRKIIECVHCGCRGCASGDS